MNQRERQVMDHNKAPLALFLIISFSAVTMLTNACTDYEGACNPLGVARYEADASSYTLITNAYRHSSLDHQSQIVFFNNDTDTVLWEYKALKVGGLLDAHHAEFLDNEMIIADTDNYRVLIAEARNGIYSENPDFQVVWNSRTDGGRVLHYPNDANFLSNGNILITERDMHRVIEINRDTGEIEWQFGVTGVRGSDDSHLDGPHNADRLPNGNTILSDSWNNRILEVDPEGTVVWEFSREGLDSLNWPRDADVLDNDNVLITDSLTGRVMEVNRGGETLWEYREDIIATQIAPYEADLLGNGNVLISLPGFDGGVVRELDYSTQDIVWSYPAGAD